MVVNYSPLKIIFFNIDISIEKLVVDCYRLTTAVEYSITVFFSKTSSLDAKFEMVLLFSCWNIMFCRYAMLQFLIVVVLLSC